MNHMSWTRLAAMAVLSFISMYVLMYLMVDRYANVYANLNQLYMTGAMTAAMMMIEVWLMRAMYGMRVVTTAFAVSLIILIASISGVRNQTAVGDQEFLKSMIPHHGAALLMCEKAQLEDPDIKKLCQRIIAGQQSEIDWMQIKLSATK